jgi:hypothetical protein
MNKFILYSILFFFTLSMALGQILDETNDVEKSDLYFSLGHQEFVNKNYGFAADYFYETLVSNPRKEIANNAVLYLALSQIMLKNKEGAAFNASYVVEEDLIKKDKIRLFKLKNILGTTYLIAERKKREEIKRIKNKFHLWMTPYYGTTSYSSSSTRDSALFYGAQGIIARGSTTLMLGGESFDLKFKDGTSSYSQKQFTTSLSHLFQEFSLSARYTQISSPLQTQDGLKIYGLGTGLFINSLSKFNLDYFYSKYPDFSIGETKINQLNASYDRGIKISEGVDLWLRIGHQMVKAKAANISDGSTFIKDKIYNRSFFDLGFRISKLQLGGSYWLGDEAFGVRNDGALVYSGLEEHIGGTSGYISYAFNSQNQLQFTYMREEINTDGIKSYSISSIAAYIFKFN